MGRQGALRSSHVGLVVSMSAIFFLPVQPFSSFSRWMASLTSPNRSNQTRRLQFVLRLEAVVLLLSMFEGALHEVSCDPGVEVAASARHDVGEVDALVHGFNNSLICK